MQTYQAFKVVIAYENLAGAVRAKEMSERLASELESKCETWKFELLAHPGLRQHAAQDAAEADMIIIALRGAGTLPGHVNEWVDAWAQTRRDSPSILVVLLDESEDEARVDDDGADTDSDSSLPGNFRFLREVAAQRGMDFLSNLERVPMLPARINHEITSPEMGSSELLLRRRRDHEFHSSAICHVS